MRASLVNHASAIALAGVAALGIASTGSAQAAILFDFNSLSDTSSNLGTSSGRSSAHNAVENYINGVLQAAGYGSNAINMPYGSGNGATGERNYTGDGYVVGLTGLSSGTPLRSNGVVPLTLGNTDYYGSHYTCTTAANCNVQSSGVFSLPNTSNDPSHAPTIHTGALDTYITNQQSYTSQFKIDIVNSALKVSLISFDFEIFPDPSNNPDFTFKFKGSDGKTYSVKYVGLNPDDEPSSQTGRYGDEDSKQLIGHLDIDTQLICGVGCTATELAFVDWPVTIGIDNLAFDHRVPPPPPTTTTAPEPMTGALMLAGLGGLWFARRRRTGAAA